LDQRVWGIDADKAKTVWLKSQKINAYYGDADDAYFWESIDLTRLELVLIALPSAKDSMSISEQLQAANYQGKIAAIARYDDEKELLQKSGIDKVFNFYNEAGVGFADESIAMISPDKLR
jgi:glutathione-regulated potassium-efflux system ancillary protein KefC